MLRNRVWLCALLAACGGKIGADDVVDDAAPGTQGPKDGVRPATLTKGCERAPIHSGVTPLRRLTRVEYDHTVADLLGDETAPAKSFPGEEKLLGFDNNATSDVSVASSALVKSYEAAAEELAYKAVESLPALMGCAAAEISSDDCARSFIDSFGLRAYRRPLEPAETEKALAFFSESKAKYGVKTAAQMFVQATLQSPFFLYRVESGNGAPNDEANQPSPYELATRLSYLLWSSAPDTALLDAAATGKLTEPSAVAEQARRMLSDPKSKRVVHSFFGQWLDLEHVRSAVKDAATYPKWNAEIPRLMQRETETFIEEVIFQGEGSLPELLQGNFSYMNRDLAEFYGVSGPRGATFERVSLDPKQRAGFLTQGAFLAGHAAPRQSSPVARGSFLLDRILCSPPPPPPPGVVTQIEDPDENSTTRERFAQHRAEPACAGCHQLIDPLGFGFEHYDGVGLWRTTDGPQVVDASGEIIDTVDLDGPFTGAIELMEKMGASTQVQDCVVKQFFRYAFARGESDADTCTLAGLGAAFAESGSNFRELMVSVTQSDPFLFRNTEALQ